MALPTSKTAKAEIQKLSAQLAAIVPGFEAPAATGHSMRNLTAQIRALRSQLKTAQGTGDAVVAPVVKAAPAASGPWAHVKDEALRKLLSSVRPAGPLAQGSAPIATPAPTPAPAAPAQTPAPFAGLSDPALRAEALRQKDTVTRDEFNSLPAGTQMRFVQAGVKII